MVKTIGVAAEPSTRTGGRRELILEAALRLIGRSGRESVTHRAVAEEAGVPLGSTTYYFESRDDLLAQALEHVAASEAARYGELATELISVKTPSELADRLISELVAAAEDRVAYIAEYELWLEAGRRPTCARPRRVGATPSSEPSPGRWRGWEAPIPRPTRAWSWR
jgi:DNA-binding transcriptional regulator YbjK